MAFLKFFIGLFSVVGKALGLVHDHNVEVGGENKIIAKDNLATAEAEHDAAQAMVNTTDASTLDDMRKHNF